MSILVVRRGDSVAAVVEDDGRGIEQPEHDEGLGLVGMRERAALVGGRVRIESSSEGGTTIAAEVPVR